MDGASYGSAYGNMFKAIFWIIGILAAIAVVCLVGWIATANKVKAESAAPGSVYGAPVAPTRVERVGNRAGNGQEYIIFTVRTGNGSETFAWLKRSHEEEFTDCFRFGEQVRVRHGKDTARLPSGTFRVATGIGIVDEGTIGAVMYSTSDDACSLTFSITRQDGTVQAYGWSGEEKDFFTKWPNNGKVRVIWDAPKPGAKMRMATDVEAIQQ